MSKKAILLLQFRENNLIARYEKNCILRSTGRENHLVVKNIFSDNSKFSKGNLLGISGIIIGGSSFNLSEKEGQLSLLVKIKKIIPILKKAIHFNVPILGICFGHQYLAYILGAKVVRNNSRKEVGTYEVSLTKAGKRDFLFDGLPKNFLVQEAHKDSIKKLPSKAILLATSKTCKIQAFKFKNAYGVQFHPELNTEDMEFRAKFSPSYIQGRKIKFKSTIFGKQILKNFLSLLQ